MTWNLVLVDLYERVKLMIGESMNNARYGKIVIMKKISENEDVISLCKIFKHIAQTLIHTSDDQQSKLQNDGDPLTFMQLLSESKGDSLLTIKDLLKETGILSLRSCCYNLPGYKVAQVTVEIDKLLLYINNGEGNESNWFVSLRKKSNYVWKKE